MGFDNHIEYAMKDVLKNPATLPSNIVKENKGIFSIIAMLSTYT